MTPRRRRRAADRSRVPGALVLVGVAAAVYLLNPPACASYSPPAVPPRDLTCHDRVVYHAARLSDC